MNVSQTRRQFLRTTTVATLAASNLPSAFGQTKKAIVLAFVGVAHIHTPEYIRLAKSRADVSVKSVWDHDAARAQMRAKELDARPVADLKEIWADPEIPAVVICSETNRHHELVLAGAKA